MAHRRRCLLVTLLGHLNQLDARAPESTFWLGSTAITVADLGLFAQLQSFRTHLTRFQGDQISLRPRLAAYLDRVDAATQGRTAAAETRELAWRRGTAPGRVALARAAS